MGWLDFILGLFVPERRVARLQERRDLAGLVRLLERGEPSVRHLAAAALGDLGDPAALDALLSALCRTRRGGSPLACRRGARHGSARRPWTASPHSPWARIPDVRWKAIVALGDIGDPQAAPILLGRLADPDRFVRAPGGLGPRPPRVAVSPAHARGALRPRPPRPAGGGRGARARSAIRPRSTGCSGPCSTRPSPSAGRPRSPSSVSTRPDGSAPPICLSGLLCILDHRPEGGRRAGPPGPRPSACTSIGQRTDVIMMVEQNEIQEWIGQAALGRHGPAA